MAATPGTIEHLAGDVVRTRDPEAALRALNALRQELEQVEPQLVRRALSAGASWSQIARALEITKQAAHKKHRHLAEQPWPQDPRHKIPITGEARRSVQLAREEARQLAQPAVGTEHLLLGILRCRANHAVKALNALGITHETALVALAPTLPGAPSSEPAAEEPDATVVSPHARRILEGALREAVRRGDGYIGVEHLLLALLADTRNGAVQTLEALKVTSKMVKRQVELECETVTRAHAVVKDNSATLRTSDQALGA
jgi:ATP-dependent Clp protease ATP-binding subunit ClpA